MNRRKPLMRVGKNIIVVVPPFGIERDAIEALRKDFIGGF
jgi:hypothetical protein